MVGACVSCWDGNSTHSVKRFRKGGADVRLTADVFFIVSFFFSRSSHMPEQANSLVSSASRLENRAN